MEPNTISVSAMQAILKKAQEYCDKNDWSPDDTPWHIGLISDEPISQRVIQRGKELAEEYGW